MRPTPSPCGICTQPIRDNTKIFFCPDCGEPYHNDKSPNNCWQKIGRKCKVINCRGNESFLWSKIERPFLKILGISKPKIKLKSICFHCNSLMSPLQKFCTNCGFEVNNSEAQETFSAFPFSKWVQYHHKVILSISSIFILMFLRWSMASTSIFIENRVHQQQTVIAYNSFQATKIKQKEIASVTALAYQNPTNTSTKPPTPIPSKTQKNTSTPKPVATRITFKPYVAINKCAKARVILGDIVTVEDDVPNLFIRSSSDNHPSNNIIGHFETGQRAKIIAGPECSWGWIMWKIRRLNDNFEGWVAESDGDDFWLKLDD